MRGFEKNGKPDYETWLKMKEGGDPLEDLANAVKRTLDSAYKGVDSTEFANRMFERDRNRFDND
jgi:hypothetical protein